MRSSHEDSRTRINGTGLDVRVPDGEIKSAARPNRCHESGGTPKAGGASRDRSEGAHRVLPMRNPQAHES
jgi:hypothetical protein